MAIDWSKYGVDEKKDEIDFSKYQSEPESDGIDWSKYETKPQKFTPIKPNIMDYPGMQQITNAPAATPESAPVQSNFEARKNMPSRNIPVVGTVLRTLDKLSDTKTQHLIADIGQTVYTPGASLSNIAGLAGSAENLIARTVPSLVAKKGGKIAQKAISEAVTGFPLGVGQYQAQGGSDNAETLKQGVLGAGLGAAGSLAGSAISKSFDSLFRRTKSLEPVAPQPVLGLPEPKSAILAREAQNRSVLPPNTDVIHGQGDIATLGLPEGQYTPPTRLKVSNPTESLDYVMNKIKPEVMGIIEAPSRRDLLVKYINKNTGYEMRDIINRPMKELQDLGQVIQGDLHGKMHEIAFDVAKRQGHDLPSLLEGQAPTLRAQLAKDAQSQVYGVPAPRVGIQRPQFNIQHVADSAMPETKVTRLSDLRNSAAATKENPKNWIAKAKRDAHEYDLNSPLGSNQDLNLMKVSKDVGSQYDAHGMAKGIGNDLDNLHKLLKNGIDSKKSFHSARLSDEGHLSPFTNGSFIVTSGKGEMLKSNGIKNVIVNDAYYHAIPDLQKEFPNVNFIKANEAEKSLSQPQKVARLSDARKTTTVDPAKPKGKSPQNERGFATTLKESDKTPQEFKDNLNPKYTPLRNVDAVTKANKRIDKNVDDAESFVMGNSKPSPEKVATAGRLIDQFNKSGDYVKAVTIAEKVSKELTEAGQTVQAASIFNRLTPEGALIRAQRKVAKINEEGTKLGKPLEVTPKNAQDIKEAAEAIQAANVSKERSSNVIDIMDKLKAKQAITEAERTAVQDFLKDAQQYVKNKENPIKERKPPIEMGERRVKDKVISFLDAQEAAAKTRMAARRGRINSLPLDEYADMAIIVAAKLAKGTIKTADISADLIKDFGNVVEPHLAGIFEKANNLITQNAKRIAKESISQAERITENYIKKNDAHIKPKDVDFVRSLAKQVSDLSGDAKKIASQDLQEVLNSFEKAGIGKKLSSVQYIAMLLNPLTQVKNIAGNELLYRLSRLSRNLQTPLDMIYSGVAGKQRTITSRSGPLQWKNFYEPTADYISGLFQGARAGWRGVNIEGLTTSYDISGQAFRSKLNPLTYLEKTLGATMKGFDYAAFNRATQQRLRETAYLDALNKGIKGKAAQIAHMDKYMVNLDDNIAEIAHEFGKKITLQDNSLLATKLQSLRGGINQLSTGGLTKDFGAGSLVLPFAKTPANLLMRAIDYSPAGFGKAIMQAGQILLKKNVDLTRADVIQSVSDAILGTGITGVGVWLASKGVLKGESSADRDVRELEKLSGLTQYQLNASALQRMISSMISGNLKDVDAAAKIQPGDALYQYEWAQPSSIPLALGANIVKERQKSAQDALKGQTQSSPVKKTLDVSLGAMNTLFNTSVLQGLQRAFDFMPGENNKIKAFLVNIIKQAPSMFVPSMVGKVNQFNDSAVRETYSPDFMDSVLNPSQAKIPGQAQKLPQRVNTLGQPVKADNSVGALFLNPAAKTTYNPNPEAKMVLDLLSETGDTTIAPRAVPKYITGKDAVTHQDKKVNLSGEQLTQYQTIVGQETLRLLGKLPDNLSTEAKVKRVVDILAQAGEKGRKEMRKELGLR